MLTMKIHGYLIPPPDLIKPPLKEESNPNEEHKNSEESPIKGEADNTDGEDNFKVKDHKDNKNNKELVVEVTTRLI